MREVPRERSTEVHSLPRSNVALLDVEQRLRQGNGPAARKFHLQEQTKRQKPLKQAKRGLRPKANQESINGKAFYRLFPPLRKRRIAHSKPPDSHFSIAIPNPHSS